MQHTHRAIGHRISSQAVEANKQLQTQENIYRSMDKTSLFDQKEAKELIDRRRIAEETQYINDAQKTGQNSMEYEERMHPEYKGPTHQQQWADAYDDPPRERQSVQMPQTCKTPMREPNERDPEGTQMNGQTHKVTTHIKIKERAGTIQRQKNTITQTTEQTTETIHKKTITYSDEI